MKKIHRRNFIKTVALGGLAWTSSGGAATKMPTPAGQSQETLAGKTQILPGQIYHIEGALFFFDGQLNSFTEVFLKKYDVAR